MTDAEFNRDDPALAEEIMKKLSPSEPERRVVLSQLLCSVAAAEQLAPHSWSVTLFSDGFRLNVGPVEAFTFFNGEIRLFLFGSVPVEAHKLGEVLSSTYRSMPQPQYVFVGAVEQFEKARPHLQAAHAAFVRAAAVTSSGKPRRSSFARAHSPGLYSYAKRIAGETVTGV